jgi:GT2 family glycosyltransferase
MNLLWEGQLSVECHTNWKIEKLTMVSSKKVILSVVIVNYNVKHFLEHCIQSVKNSSLSNSTEIIVIDNASSDLSQKHINNLFPDVKYVYNDSNKGFSAGCNEGLAIAQGDYLLLLNPDVILSENSLQKCIDFFSKNDKIGGVGVHMIDGSGLFLPESKRGLPTPMVSLIKMTGLGRLFPKSGRLNRYHQSHLDPDMNHEVEVLSGAFLMFPRKVLEKVGGLDERYFMYGEDVDFSYQILKNGWKNFFLGEVKIIHFKGESTKRSSKSYVKHFYNAMRLFAEKNLLKGKSGIARSTIKFGIWLSSLLHSITNIIKPGGLLVCDILFLFLGLKLVSVGWAHLFFGNVNYFPNSTMWFNFPLYTSVWIISYYFGKGYEQKVLNFGKFMVNVLIGTIVLLAIYGLMPVELRSSRALIVLGMFWALAYGWISRLVSGQVSSLSLVPIHKYWFGEKEQMDNWLKTLSNEDSNLVNITRESEINSLDKQSILIFEPKFVNYSNIVSIMAKFKNRLTYFIHSSKSDVLIGSHSKSQQGGKLQKESFKLDEKFHLRNKRMLEVVVSILIPLLIFPLLINRNKVKVLKNCLKVIKGKIHWVSYFPGKNEDFLPIMYAGVIGCKWHIGEAFFTENLEKLNYLYAKEYSTWKDLYIILRNLRRLDQTAK